nr:hypothetical protein [Tanacetum cinerariifolium]
MESLSPQVVFAAKLPILNPNEFDLWKMRIEQYFLMTDYSLWEVILNGDSPAPTKVIDGFSSESLDQIHDRLQKLISQLEILGVSLSQEDINLNLKINEAEPVSADASVSTVSAKLPVSALSNVYSLSNAVIYSFFGRNLRANGPTSMGFDMSKVECYNCHRKGYFARECRSPKVTRRNDEEPTKYALMAFSSSSSSSDHELRDNALVVLRQNLKKAKQERDDLKLKLEKFQTSSKNLSKLRQTNDKTGLGYNSQVFTRAMFDCDGYLSSGVMKVYPLVLYMIVSTIVPKIKVTRPRQATTIFTKSKSPPRRHINPSPSPKASTFLPKVTTVKAPMVNAAHVVQGKWKWKPKCPVLDHVSRNTSASMTLKRFDYNDALGRSKSLNGGYVAFGGNPKGGKISRKGKIRTGKLDFDDVYFVKELQFNLCSVSQMCDKKNSVFFNDTECLVLSPDFTLPDENQNRVLVTKPQNKTPYKLLHGRTTSIGFMRPFGCLVTILNTLDSLRKFDGKVDEGFLVGYSVSSKAFRVFNSRTRIIQETMHIKFMENKPNVAGSGPTWLFDIDTLTKTMNYQPVTAEFEDFSNNSINKDNAAGTLVPTVRQISTNNTNTFSAAGPSNVAASLTHRKSSCIDTCQYSNDLNMLELEYITYSDNEDDVGAEAEFSNLETSITVSPIPTTRVHKDHHVTQIIEPKMVHQDLKDPSWIEAMQEELLQFKMQKVWVLVDFPPGKGAIGHTQEEGINYEEVFDAVARIEAIRLLLAYASLMGYMLYQMDVKSAFLYGTIKEEVYVCQTLGFKDPDYPDKVYKVVKALYGLHQAPRAWQKGDILLVQIYVNDIIFGSTNKDLCKAFEKLMKDKFQMSSIGELTFFLDGKSASTPIDTEKPLLKNPDVKRIFRYLKGKSHLGLWYPKYSPFNLVAYLNSHYVGPSLDRKSTTGGCQFFGCRLISSQCKKQTVVATSSTEAEYVTAASCCAQVLWIQNQLLIMGVSMLRCDGDSLELIELTVFLLPSDEKVRVKVNDVTRLQALVDKKRVYIKLLELDRKSASTPIDTKKPLLKDPDGKDVDVHTYRSMIGSLMYLTSSRPDIMFAVFACSHFQVTPKALHLHAVKRIFRYLKGKPHLGLWYPKDLPFNLVAYSDGDYASASLDWKSTIGGCQFLGCRLISWQYKKQTVVATSSTEAEYVAAAICCAQVLWI